MRARLLERVQERLSRQGWPRLQMTLIVAGTGAAGFLASYVLLHLGLRSMPVRYPLAVALAYGAFLLLIWFWVLWQRGVLPTPDLAEEVLDVLEPELGGDKLPVTGAGSTLATETNGQLASSVEFGPDEFLLLVAALLAIGSAVAASIWVIVAAPSLLAEVLLDGVLVAGLYRRLRRLDRRDWLESTVLRTCFPITIVIIFFLIAGAVMQWYAPEAVSLAEVWERVLGPR